MLGRDDVELLSSSQTFTTAVQTQLLLPLVVEYETPVSKHFLISVFVFFRVCNLRPVLNCRCCHKTHSLVPPRLYKSIKLKCVTE